MELMERYVYAVTRCLPTSQRSEVGKEIRAMIEDMVAAKSEKGKPTFAAYKTVIKELGSPEKLALEYGQANHYLVGPRWYDLYIKTLQLLLFIVPPVLAINVGLVHMADSKSVLESIIAGIGAALQVIVHIVFWLTLIFAIIERSGVKPKPEAAKWNIDDLPELPGPRQISVSDTIVGTVMVVVSAIIVVSAASFPMWWSEMPQTALNPALWEGWIQGFLALGAASLLLELAKFRIGNWTPVLTVINVILSVAWGVFILAAILTQDVINPAFISEVQAKTSEINVKEILEWATNITIVLIVIGCAWNAIESVYKAIILRRG